jgi:tRNA threonylcarbamoyl adenosine modification protein YjeE
MPLNEPPTGQCAVTIGDLKDVDRFAAAFVASLPSTALITLEGDLGAGKTTLVKAIAGAAGIDPATVTSPTFGLIHLHDTPDGSLHIVHADMYRLSDMSELLEIGWEDAVTAIPGCRCWAFVEWPERIALALPAERLNISLTITGETSRRLTLTGVGDPYATISQAFLERLTCD